MSVIGPGHKRTGLPNQDAWLFRGFNSGVALAVSDGLGSKPFSDKGAKAVCRAVIDTARIIRCHPQGDFKNIPELIHALWLLKIGDINPAECSATCLFAVQRGEKITLGRLGDGLILCVGKNRFFDMEDKKEDFFSNITNCMSGSFTADEWEIIEIAADDYVAVILCTDGVANDIAVDRRVDFVKSLYMEYKGRDRKKRSREITKWLADWPVPGHSDDKTLACLYREDSEDAELY
jgi:serine/threonine protein phosphatase PrpC